MASPTVRTAESKHGSQAVSTVARVRESLAESIRVKRALLETCAPQIADAGDRIASAFRAGNKALLFGNGGSAADAAHIAAEWVGRFVMDRPALPAIALPANLSEVTAIANDYGFEQLFVRQIEAHGQPGDVAIAISTSGNSPNVVEALRTARARGLLTVALAGKGGGKLPEVADIVITVPSEDTPRIQEAHITIGHVLCEIVDAALFGDSSST